jgi:heme/copper-type cytochrome/quinol oxidase subunit 2
MTRHYRVHQGININQIEVFLQYIPFILLWCFYLVLVIILWKKSEKIANKIVGEDKQDINNVDFDYNRILSTGLIVLGIFIIIDTLPVLFSYISNYVVSKTRFGNNDFLREFSIKSVIEIIGIIIKIIISFVIIVYNDKVIEKINNFRNKKSNVA